MKGFGMSDYVFLMYECLHGHVCTHVCALM